MKCLVSNFVLLFLATALLYGQEGLYYYGPNYKPVQGQQDTVHYIEVLKKSDRKFVTRTFQLVNDQWKMNMRERIRVRNNGNQVILYRANSFFPKKMNRELEEISTGLFHFNESSSGGQVRTGSSSSRLPLHLEGRVTEYHSNGELKSISEFSDNQLLSNENWLPDGSRYIDSIFYSADQNPEYRMGDKFFKSYLIQQLSRSKIDLSQIEDEVVIGWVVMETGKIDGVIALKGKSQILNEFLVKTIDGLPGTWQPATLDGKPVRYFMSIPLNFIHKEVRFQDVEFSGGVMHYNIY